MIRWSLLLVLAAALVAYAFWVYLRVELAVPGARRLAVVRAAALVLVLVLLFDVRLPAAMAGRSGTSWVLLDASLSMAADPAAWDRARRRAAELGSQGWNVVTFGEAVGAPESLAASEPHELRTLLAPALARAAEAGAREVRVLSDFRLEDQVAVRSALASLPLTVTLEPFGDSAANAGVSRFEVPDVRREGDSATARVEVHGGTPGDSVGVQVLEEGRVVATVKVAAPSPGLRVEASVPLPPASTTGRVRYTAAVTVEGDAFASDDSLPAFANVGHEEGGLVLVSLEPDWEPRFLLPVLEDATGLPASGYLRVGPDRFVTLGRAVERGAPVDSAAVGAAAAEAALLVVHAAGADADAWGRALVEGPHRKLVMVKDARGATLAGLPATDTRGGEWYLSGEVPPSPIAGALAGVRIEGLPPLTDVVVPSDAGSVRAPLSAQLRGAGLPQPVLHLAERPEGRVAVALASGFWRWAARPTGREPYQRLWSGVAGWLLADRGTAAGEPRPARWVVPRGEPVLWNVPARAAGARVQVSTASGDGAQVVDTALGSGAASNTGPLPPGPYRYVVLGQEGDTLGTGRFDVSAATEEMVPPPEPPEVPAAARATAERESDLGPPLRTEPWPYLLVIVLLCAEWVGRRRSGLR